MALTLTWGFGSWRSLVNKDEVACGVLTLATTRTAAQQPKIGSLILYINNCESFSPTVSDWELSSKDQHVSKTESRSESSMIQDDLLITVKGQWKRPLTWK